MYGSVSNQFDFKFFENNNATSACNKLQALIFWRRKMSIIELLKEENVWNDFLKYKIDKTANNANKNKASYN